MKSLLNKATAGLEPEPAPKIKVPNIGNLDSIDLPIPVRRVESKPVREEVLDASKGLDNLTAKALKEAEEIRDMELEPSDENFPAVHYASPAGTRPAGGQASNAANERKECDGGLLRRGV